MNNPRKDMIPYMFWLNDEEEVLLIHYLSKPLLYEEEITEIITNAHNRGDLYRH